MLSQYSVCSRRSEIRQSESTVFWIASEGYRNLHLQQRLGRTALPLLIECLIQCSGCLFTPDPRVQEEEAHQKVQEEEAEQAREQVTRLIHPAMHTQEEEEEQVPIAREEESHQEETPWQQSR